MPPSPLLETNGLKMLSRSSAGTPGPSSSTAETTQPFLTAAQMASEDTLDLMLEPGEPKTIPVKRGPPAPLASSAPPTPAAHDATLDFDLGSLSTEPPTIATKLPPQPEPALDFGDFSIGGEPLTALPPADHSADPLSRKLELAEEFRHIGVLVGGRDLLEEVVAKSSGTLQAKAQGMLDKLV